MVLYKVNKFLKERFEAVPSVKTITTDTEDNIDWYSNSQYPLVNINMINAIPIEGVHRINFTIGIYKQRDTVAKQRDGKYLTDNMIDNLESAYTIASQMINNLYSFYNEDFIEIFNLSEITFLKNVRAKNLDGVQFSITLEIDDSLDCE